MARILISFGVPAEGFHSLQGHELLIPKPGKAFTRAETLDLLPRADAVLACSPLDREMILSAGRLKIIVCYGAGYDAIDVETATKRRVPVVNIPDCVTAPTAELAAAHILALARRLPELDAAVRSLPGQEVFVMGRRMGASLEGAALGIVGMGRIGSRVADFGRVMGMRVLYTSRTPKPERDALGDLRVPLSALMAEADFISVHCPHTPETDGLISRAMSARMKPTAFLVNTARGPVVDEAALIEALQARRIAGAGLDVFTAEPNVNPAFFTLDNVLLTPHAGSNTERTRRRMAEAASERILDALAGRAPQNLLNPEALSGV